MKRAAVLATLMTILMATAMPARAADDQPAGPDDPLESFNRMMFSFNQGVARHVVEPVAGVLETWLPHPVRQAGRNAYANLTEPEFIVTNWIAGDGGAAAVSAARFVVNTTAGIGGLLDPATAIGLEPQKTEMGAAMCGAGLPSGPYVVLPLIGATNAVTAGLVGGFFAVEWTLLSMVSTTVATADLVIDLSASAASLRHVGDAATAGADPYDAQRAEYQDYLAAACGNGNALPPGPLPPPRRRLTVTHAGPLPGPGDAAAKGQS